jgi:hypothetical protein
MTSVGRLPLLKYSTLGLSSWDLVLNWHPFDGISTRIKAWNYFYQVICKAHTSPKLVLEPMIGGKVSWYESFKRNPISGHGWV